MGSSLPHESNLRPDDTRAGRAPGEAGARKSTELVNLTPHALVVRWEGGEVELASAGVARVSEIVEPVGDVAGIPLVRVRPGAVSGLPDQREGVWFLVSRLVAQALPDRGDLLFPHGEIRDDAGRIEAVRSLGRF